MPLDCQVFVLFIECLSTFMLLSLLYVYRQLMSPLFYFYPLIISITIVQCSCLSYVSDYFVALYHIIFPNHYHFFFFFSLILILSIQFLYVFLFVLSCKVVVIYCVEQMQVLTIALRYVMLQNIKEVAIQCMVQKVLKGKQDISLCKKKSTWKLLEKNLAVCFIMVQYYNNFTEFLWVLLQLYSRWILKRLRNPSRGSKFFSWNLT